MNNEIKINVPEGMEIDKEHSTFECIKFKPKWIPKKGDIAAAGDNHCQIILVNEYIRKSSIVGFDVDCLAVMNTSNRLLTLFNDKESNDTEFWVSEEASDSEKKVFINELNKQGYVYDPNDPRIIYKKEKELPKTWKEFCDNNPIKPNEVFITNESNIVDANFHSNERENIVDANLLPSKEYAEAMLALCKLIQLRDCYNDGWKPDWKSVSSKFVIRIYSGIPVSDTVSGAQSLLAFKTRKLRETFFSNFRDLIEQAKLLL